jgi:para-aminobenzoate synthetase component 1
VTPTALPLVEELIPAPEPWEVARRLAHLPHLLFLDSADRDPPFARYSYVAAAPREWIQIDSTTHADPLGMLARRIASEPAPTIAGVPPFQGGLAGLFGYGLCHTLERIPWPRVDEFHTPDLAVGVYDWVISFDHHLGRAWLVSHTGAVREIRDLLSRPPQTPVIAPSHHSIIPSFQHPLPGFRGVTSNFDRSGFEVAVRRAVEYIRAGDCFQVNLSQRLLTPLTMPPLELYSRLRERNPAPFAGYFDLGDFAIASASPERFLSLSSTGDVETRPIKGTRPRGRTPAEDDAHRHDLLASPKDRAENVMIVDLMRNDLGRVCEYGSVRVAQVCQLETYRTVHHLVSEIVGKLRSKMTAVDLLRAAFPGGSVTGAPKVRAMEIIAELEPTARGPYCGSLGYIGFDGVMDTNILIRTFTLGRGWAQFPVGGGIVADSNPAAEYEETLHKAAGLLRALE